MRWLAVLYLLTLVIAVDAQEAPYLYYYDYDQRQFIVMRADGGDYRLLNAGLMQDQYPAGPGFSPSGVWFAWTGFTENFELPNVPEHAYYISTDGQTQVMLEREFADVSLQWSPTEDILLLLGEPYDEEETKQHLQLIDPATGEVLAAVDDVPHGCKRPRWMDDQVMIPCDSMVYVLSISGEAQVIELAGEVLDQPTSGGWIAYPTLSYELQLLNLLSGESRDVDFYLYRSDLFQPNPVHDAFVTRNIDGIFWLVNLETDVWLDLGEDVRLLENPWSPGGDYLLYRNADNEAFVVSTLSGETVSIVQNVGYMDHGAWLSNEQFIFSRGVESVIYHVADDTSQTVRFQPLWGLSNVALTENYLASMQDGAVTINLSTGEMTSISPDSRAFRTQAGGEVIWDASGEWLITRDDALRGNAPSIRYIGVTNHDGSVRQELSFCLTTIPCIGWLPENIDPALLPAYVPPTMPEPVQVIHGFGWHEFMEWQDNAIATGYTSFADTGITGFDLETGTAPGLMPFVPEFADEAYFEPRFWNDGIVVTQSAELAVMLNGDVYETTSGALVTQLPHGLAHDRAAIFSPDGRYLVVTRRGDFPLTIYDTQTWEARVHDSLYTIHAAFSPDGSQLAIGQGWDIVIYEFADLK